MPKMKTRKAAAKRFKFTSNGKIKRRRAKTRHLLEGKTSSAKRRLSKSVVVSKSDVARIKSMMPGN